MRARVWFDRLIVLLVLLALWQAGSATFGDYWLSTPWSTVTRFFAALFNGELVFHGGYTISEALAGCVIGGVPAVPAAVLLGPAPGDAGRPAPVKGGRLWGAEACLWAAVHSVVAHRHRAQGPLVPGVVVLL